MRNEPAARGYRLTLPPARVEKFERRCRTDAPVDHGRLVECRAKRIRPGLDGDLVGVRHSDTTRVWMPRAVSRCESSAEPLLPAGSLSAMTVIKSIQDGTASASAGNRDAEPAAQAPSPVAA